MPKPGDASPRPARAEQRPQRGGEIGLPVQPPHDASPARGALFLGDRGTLAMAGGCAVFLPGVALTTGLLRPRPASRPA